MDVLALMRWQALLSVEDMLREIFALVDEYDAMERTFFLYTSDHGFHMGQHNLAAGEFNSHDVSRLSASSAVMCVDCLPDKRENLDTDLRIPFFIRGPGVTAGRELPQVTGMVDIPPTIMALAGLASSSAQRWGESSHAELLT